MMATITTKYSVGDTVFRAGTTSVRKQHPCPDCKGARKWKATSPAGGVYEFACPRCASSYNSDRDLQLDYSAYVPSVEQLTIGSIQVNTAPMSYDTGNRYMCRETGIGSGSVYNEDDLFETEEAATQSAQFKANEKNTTVEWIVKLYNKSLAISDYQLDSAALKLAKQEKSRASSMIWNIGDLFGRIEDADDKDAILEAIKEYREYDWQSDKDEAAKEMEPA
jgi:hypothetical protein